MNLLKPVSGSVLGFVLALLCAALVGSGQSASKGPLLSPENDFKKLMWLEGTWNRTNAKPGWSGHERWTRLGDHELQGFGVSMVDADTVYLEKLRIIIMNEAVYYVVDVPENAAPVLFRMTEIGNRHFVCENAQHDFPKKITYWVDDTQLNAMVSGDGKFNEFRFERTAGIEK